VRILFDQGTPVPLRNHLPSHEVATAFELHWSTLTNGDLLLQAEAAGFDLLVTTDQNLRYQQNLAAAHRGSGALKYELAADSKRELRTW
jgi:hypothetical protein